MHKSAAIENVTLAGNAGKLEAVLETPQTTKAVAVVAHPHPLYGGTMDNAVVRCATDVLLDNQVACLRFNFRGVGKSEGGHDNGAGEIDDLKVAISWLADWRPNDRAQPTRPNLWLVGYSFGAATILRLEGNRSFPPSAVLLLAPPLSVYDFREPELFALGSESAGGGSTTERPKRNPRIAVIYGEDDDFTAPPHRAAFSNWGAHTFEVEGVGHDLGTASGQTARLATAVEGAVTELSGSS